MKAVSSLLIVALAGAAIFISGCGKSPQVFGEAISNYEATEIKNILAEPQNYADKTITITGEIVRECPTGCWLDVGEENAALHVDIKPAGLAIPQEVGSQVVVEGTIRYEDNQVSMLGQGVEIQ